MQSYKKWIIAWSLIGISAFGIFSYTNNTLVKKVAEVPQSSTEINKVVIEDSVKPEVREAVAYVSEVTGEVLILNGSSILPLSTQKILYGGELLKSSSGGSAEIILIDNSLIRLAASSTLEIENANEVKLTDGSLWARILKPLTSSDTFQVKTNDLSAGVRGTAVSISTSVSGSIVTVVDSSIDTWAVTVQSGSGSSTSLNVEQMLSVTEGKVTPPIQVDMKKLLAEPWVNTNLKSDIIYLAKLSDVRSINIRRPLQMRDVTPEILTKIEKEIAVSLPKKEEVSVFFGSKAIAAEFERSMLSGALQENIQSRNTLMSDLMKWENELQELKIELKTQSENPQKIQETKKKIESFDTDFMRKMLAPPVVTATAEEKLAPPQWVSSSVWVNPPPVTSSNRDLPSNNISIDTRDPLRIQSEDPQQTNFPWVNQSEPLNNIKQSEARTPSPSTSPPKVPPLDTPPSPPANTQGWLPSSKTSTDTNTPVSSTGSTNTGSTEIGILKNVPPTTTPSVTTNLEVKVVTPSTTGNISTIVKPTPSPVTVTPPALPPTGSAPSATTSQRDSNPVWANPPPIKTIDSSGVIPLITSDPPKTQSGAWVLGNTLSSTWTSNFVAPIPNIKTTDSIR